MIDDAVAHFERSVAYNEKIRHLPFLAWSHYYLGETLKLRNEQGDRETADTHLHCALEMARRYNLLPLEERITELFTSMNADELKTHPDGLTMREIDVLKELAQGKTDQEIADALFISPKTASNHVSNILRKTGTGNRTEAAYAHARGLTEVQR